MSRIRTRMAADGGHVGYVVTLRPFLLKNQGDGKTPPPFRMMKGWVDQETAKGLLMHLHGTSWPSVTCLQCSRELTHPISLMLGLGPKCSGLNYQVNVSKEELDQVVKSLQQAIASTTWEGWLPKGFIELEEQGESLPIQDEIATVHYDWHGKRFQYVGNDGTKLYRIEKYTEIVRWSWANSKGETNHENGNHSNVLRHQ